MSLDPLKCDITLNPRWNEPKDNLGAVIWATVLPLLIVLWIIWPSDSITYVELIPRSVRCPQVIEKPQYRRLPVRPSVNYATGTESISDSRAEDLAEAGILSDSRVEDLAEDLGYLKP